MRRLSYWLTVALLVVMVVVFAACAGWFVDLGYYPSAVILAGCSIGSGWCLGQWIATERWRRRQ